MRKLLVGAGRLGLAPRWVPDSSEVFAVRIDWPDLRTHQFVAPRLTETGARRAARSVHAYWRRSSLRPSVDIVRISANDFRIHRGRGDCRAPDCPGRPVTGAAGWGLGS